MHYYDQRHLHEFSEVHVLPERSLARPSNRRIRHEHLRSPLGQCERAAALRPARPYAYALPPRATHDLTTTTCKPVRVHEPVSTDAEAMIQNHWSLLLETTSSSSWITCSPPRRLYRSKSKSCPIRLRHASPRLSRTCSHHENEPPQAQELTISSPRPVRP
jgi:hypothetical protein